MKSREEQKSSHPRTAEPHYRFRLFIAANGPNSTQARENLAELCESYLPGQHEIEIIDVLEDSSAAIENDILVTPALILIEPAPSITILGNLSNREQVLRALRMESASP